MKMDLWSVSRRFLTISWLQHWFDHILGYSGEIHAEKFGAHLPEFIDTECKRVLVSLYSSSAHVDGSTPVIILSIDMLSAI